MWWPPIPDPEPHPEWLSELHLGFAARLAVASEQFEGTRLAATLGKAIDRSIGTIESGNSKRATE